MKIKYFVLLILPFFVSCVGEDIRNVEEEFTVTFNNTLFSVAIDENRDEKLDIIPRLTSNVDDLPEGLRFSIRSGNPDILEIEKQEEGKNLRYTPVNQGTATLILEAFAPQIDPVTNESVEVLIAEAQKNVIVGVQTLTIAEVNGIDESRALEIANVGFTDVSITNSIESIGVDSSEQITLQALLTDRNNDQPEGAVFEWQSENPNILAVSPTGLLTPVEEGQTNIIATLSNPENFQLNVGAELSITIPIEVLPGAEIVEIEPEPEPEPLPVSNVAGFGDFIGTGYRVTGSFEIINDNGQFVINLSDDFRTSFLPDLVIYLSNSTTSNANALIIDDTIGPSGAQSFNVPAGTDLNDYAHVLLFCRAFGAEVGFGTIQR